MVKKRKTAKRKKASAPKKKSTGKKTTARKTKKPTVRKRGPAKQKIPAGFELLHTLRGHKNIIYEIAWSPDGRTLASGSDDRTIRLWDGETAELRRTLKGHKGSVFSVSWSPDGRTLASGSEDSTIRLWDSATGEVRHTLKGHRSTVPSVSWSPDGKTLASGSIDRTIRLWNPASGEVRHTLKGHRHLVLTVSYSPDGKTLASGSGDGSILLWDTASGEQRRSLKGHSDYVREVRYSPDGKTLASGSDDRTIRLWDPESGRQLSFLEGHTSWVLNVCYSPDGRLLVSKAWDDTVRLWRTDTGVTLAILDEPSADYNSSGLAFHPTEPILATLGVGKRGPDTAIHLWRLDYKVLLRQEPAVPSAHYVNAKVVLVGNTSVGKTGLGLVLAGRKFRPTESSHGRHVWQLESVEKPIGKGRVGTHETLLWDLAGQPGYRLIHQLHLSEVAVALVLFDSRSETDPFVGVPYWARALDEATRGFPLVKFLVASRIDRTGPQVSKARIKEVMKRYGFTRYFATSAKSGEAIEKLLAAIRKAIRWRKLVNVSTTELFKNTKSFLVGQKRQGRIIVPEPDLLTRFTRTRRGTGATQNDFSTCVGLLESTGLVRRLSFGDHVLLQPEMLDDYCAWMAQAARKEPDGLGYLGEKRANRGKFTMDDDRRLRGKPEEKAILLATIQEVVGRGIAIRQDTERGPMLVFPSELSADLPDYPGGYSLAVAFRFEGPVSAIYATLAVALINSITFKKEDLFKNAALFRGPREQICGFAVEYPDKSNDAVGRLIVFFKGDTAKDIRLVFLRYVNQQLERLAFQGSVERERIYHCELCERTIPRDVVEIRMRRDETTVICGGCGSHYPLDDLSERSAESDEQLDSLNASAVVERAKQGRLAVIKERQRTEQFHVFLCHNSKDKPVVGQLADKLLEQGVLAWLDEREGLAGDSFPAKLEKVIDAARVVAVIFGPHGMGRWEKMEYLAALHRYVEDRDEDGRRRLRLIPILLPGVAKKPDLPPFLRGIDYVDLRDGGTDNRDQIQKLVAGILGDAGRVGKHPA